MKAGQLAKNGKSQMHAEAERIVAKLKSKGYETYFAGGCVRDMLLGLPAKDIDICTSATPNEILKIYPPPRGKKIGAHFGVIMVNTAGYSFDVATFRKDLNYTDGRRPEGVVFTSSAEDAKRRDFTINGIFYDPIDKRIIDFVGGENDIRRGIIRAIGLAGERFAEDHLRMLRAIRFASRLRDFGFRVEEETWSAICANAKSINNISKERIREEFNLILLDKNRIAGLEMLCESGLMAEIFPEFLDLRGCDQPPEFHPEGDVFVHTLLLLKFISAKKNAENVSLLELVLSALLHDIGKPATQVFDETAGRFRFNSHEHVGARMAVKILRRLKYSNKTVARVAEAVDKHMAFKDVQNMRQHKLRRFMSRENFDMELELHRLDCLASHGSLDNYDFLLKKRSDFANEPIIPEPLIKGKDLISLGLKPGPDFAKILSAVQDLQLEGKLTTKDQALDWFVKKRNELLGQTA